VLLAATVVVAVREEMVRMHQPEAVRTRELREVWAVLRVSVVKQMLAVLLASATSRQVL
jgi:hypothetical protein